MDRFNRCSGSIVALGGAALAILGTTVGCSKKQAAAPATQEVQVVSVRQEDVPIVQEWVGSLDGFVNAQIRAQVSGYLVKQDYKEGTNVRKGDVLFEIDPRPFEASLAQAEALLAEAKAQLGKADEDVKRDTPLVKDNAISQEELDDATQSRLAGVAQVQAAQAAVDGARLSLGFTKVVSPVDGIAGLVSAQIGELVGPTTGALTTVSQVDPIKAYFPISEQTYLKFRRRDPGAGPIPKKTQFELILSDGSVYPKKGTFFAIDSGVDANTGSLRVVALFPNPDFILRPGQYARLRAAVDVVKGALVVPQRALNELQGGYQAAVVDATDHAHIVPVAVGDTVGNDMIVLTGLHPGDRVVADGTQKIVDGAAVHAVPFQAESPK